MLPEMPECLELPRPWQVIRTAGWSLIEAVGLPVGAWLGVAALAGSMAGVLAGLGAAWLVVGLHKVVRGKVPGLLMISALMLCIQAVLVLLTGQVWIYLLQLPVAKLLLSVLFARSAGTPEPLVSRLATEVASLRHDRVTSPGLQRFFQGNTWLWAGVFAVLAATFAVLIATEPVQTFLVMSTIATVAAVGTGIAVSLLWFRAVLKRHSLRFRVAAKVA